MKKFLLLPPAFVLCFFGGRHLLPAPADRIASLKATCVLEDLPGSAESYKRWKEGQKDIEDALASAAKRNANDAISITEEKNADTLIDKIKLCKTTFDSNKLQIDWCKGIEVERPFTDVKKAWSGLGEIAGAIKAGPSGKKFEARMKLCDDYQNGRINLKVELQKNEEQLKALGNRPLKK